MRYTMAELVMWMIEMNFPERLANLRKQRQLTQQALADDVGINVSQLKRYEAGTSQPTLEVLRKLAISLSVSADVLLFDHDERGPEDELRLQFEAITKMSSEEKHIIKALLEGMIIKHQTRQIVSELST